MESNRNLHLSLVAFKRTIRRNPFRGEHIYHERKDMKYKMLIYSTKKKFGLKIENTLACLSGAQVSSNDAKIEVKHLVTHSL